MRSFVLILVAFFMLNGCGHEDLRARYQAEKARYWAERQALQFSLQADPQMRRRFYESGLSYLEVVQVAAPALQRKNLAPEIRAELVELESWGRLQAGSSFLRAGYFELAEPELAAAQSNGPERYRREAALLRAEAARVRRQWPLALEHYRAFQSLLRDGNEEIQWSEELLQIPLAFLDELRSNGPADLVEEARLDGHAFYAWIMETWPGTPMAQRVAFLDHRLDLVAGRWEEAREGIEAYASGELNEVDYWNARFDLAEILGPGLGMVDEAGVIYQEVGESAPDDFLQGLAWLRRGELLLEDGRIEEGLEALELVEESYRKDPQTVSAAIFTRAQYFEEQGEWSQAQQLYRRIIMRHPDTPAGIMAPLRMIELQRARGDGRAAHGAILGAETQYRRLVAGHSVDGPIGLQARRSLIQCLLWGDKPEEALAELEQLHHILGRGPGGAEALLDAARIAGDQLSDPELSRRYLEWIVRELPVTPAAAEAREMLQGLPESYEKRVGD